MLYIKATNKVFKILGLSASVWHAEWDITKLFKLTHFTDKFCSCLEKSSYNLIMMLSTCQRLIIFKVLRTSG